MTAEGDGVTAMPASTTVPAYHARRVVVTVDGPLCTSAHALSTHPLSTHRNRVELAYAAPGSRVLVQPEDGGPARTVALVPAAAPKPQPRTEAPAWAASITVVPARIQWQADQARHRIQVVNRSDVALTVQAAIAGAAAREYRAPAQVRCSFAQSVQAIAFAQSIPASAESGGRSGMAGATDHGTGAAPLRRVHRPPQQGGHGGRCGVTGLAHRRSGCANRARCVERPARPRRISRATRTRCTERLLFLKILTNERKRTQKEGGAHAHGTSTRG